MNKAVRVLMAVGTLTAIISLAVFMFTASSALFSILSGIGAVSVILMYDKCITTINRLKDMTSDGCFISQQSLRLFQKLKDDYRERHPEDKFFDP